MTGTWPTNYGEDTIKRCLNCFLQKIVSVSIKVYVRGQFVRLQFLKAILNVVKLGLTSWSKESALLSHLDDWSKDWT